jgi:hypothetical protein
MKRIIQLTLLCIVTISVFIFNNLYFPENKKPIIETNFPEDQLNKKTENNIIKNLKYEVQLEQNNSYIIISKISEVKYVKNVELVEMRDVVAKFIDKNNLTLIIKSDEAIYNNSNYNTKFRKNVRIEYMNNEIFSDKVDIDFQENTVRIFDNVKYVGIDSAINSDNITINLITKKVDIYMNNKNDNVEITKSW